MFRIRKRHVFGADLDWQEVIAEAALWRGRKHEEHHDGAVHRHQRQVKTQESSRRQVRQSKQRLQYGPTRPATTNSYASKSDMTMPTSTAAEREHDVLDAYDLVINAKMYFRMKPVGAGCR